MSISEIKIELNNPRSREEWESYVYRHPEGHLRHLPQWKEVLEDTFHYQPFYLFARNENDELCGILSLFQVKGLLTGKRLVSLPFSNTCGPIADSDYIAGKLVDEAKRLCHELKCSYLELRMKRLLDTDFEVNHYFSTYVLELSGVNDEVWGKLDKKGVRWAIKKAQRDEITVREANSMEDVAYFFHKLNEKHKRDLGVPVHPFKLFQAIYRRMGKYTSLYFGELNGKIIGGIIVLKYKDTNLYYCGAWDNGYLKYHPNSLLLWRAIEKGCEEGYRYFDFGKTSTDNVGLSHFKKDWGSERNQLYFHYYPKAPKSLWLNREGAMWRIITTVWKRLPVPLATCLSKFAFKQLE